ncbi:MAG TPA: zf-HC2 domain-containing protein [Acidobacteriaceae bacterium]|nr:zf-HC2 domain-containing protein [Acidobacteriaceae bacterium]
MQTDNHESICRLIDKSLAGDISGQEEQSVRQHLLTCSACRQYQDVSNRAIAGLGGFAFGTDPNLPGKIFAALAIRAAQLETQRLSHRKLAWSYAAALVLTLAGSFAAIHLGDWFATAFSATHQQIQLGLVALWIVPSVFFCLLLPTLPMMSKRWMHAKGVSL